MSTSAEFSMVNSFGLLVMTVSSFQFDRRCGLWASEQVEQGSCRFRVRRRLWAIERLGMRHRGNRSSSAISRSRPGIRHRAEQKAAVGDELGAGREAGLAGGDEQH